MKHKRALVSYITHPFRLSKDDPRNSQFSNIGIARSIIRVLNELGYIVDVIEYTDTQFIPKLKYDLFIAHGGINPQLFMNCAASHPTMIYFSTGTYWRYSNQQTTRRLEDLKYRRGVQLVPDRWNFEGEEWALDNAAGIICIGSDNIRKTYQKYPLVLTLNNASYCDDSYESIKKNFVRCRKNFLFFSGSGNIHKGLDLLLEAFSQLDAHLFICQKYEPQFVSIYQKELSLPNIHSYGYIQNRGVTFYELVTKCNFIIFPSCSDASPGSVVECMNQGLIPIVSRDSNVETKDFGFTLYKCNVEEIIHTVKQLSQMPPEQCRQMSQRARKAALTQYSEEVFIVNMKNAISYILNSVKDKQNKI